MQDKNATLSGVRLWGEGTQYSLGRLWGMARGYRW